MLQQPKMKIPVVSEKEKQIIMKNIEKKTEEKIEIAKNSKRIVVSDSDPKKTEDSMNLLVDIMKVGSEEFQAKMGRPMTYSEIREMYG